MSSKFEEVFYQLLCFSKAFYLYELSIPLNCYGQVVLGLQNDGKLTTSDDPPVVFGCLDEEFIEKVCPL